MRGDGGKGAVITIELLDSFLGDVQGQPMTEGTRYAREARVGDFVGTGESVTTVVRGQTGDYEAALWAEDAWLNHRCNCPSWRNPCKHVVAAVLVLRQIVSGTTDEGLPAEEKLKRWEGLAVPDPEEARRQAIEGRRLAARREKLTVATGEPPFLLVASPSGFSYRVHLRGDADAPHSCDCPDFEANRLHTCKHVERGRAFLKAPRTRLPTQHRRLAQRPRIYLHFGELVEPRLLGMPKGHGGPTVRAAFDDRGVPLRPIALDEAELLDWLSQFGSWVEPEAIAWVDARVGRRPELPEQSFRKLVGRVRGKPYAYQWLGSEFLARTGRALLADEMGLGKTAQAILAAVALRQADSPVRHVTIVCPASLRGGWQDEIGKWIAEDTVLLEGPALRRAETIASRPRWLITHYEQVRRDYRHHEAQPPDLLIIDEAQRAKGLWSKTARVLKTIGARHVFALTGTPVENRLEEAYAIAQLLDQRLLPPLWQIDRDHFVREPDRRRVVMYRNLDALRSKLAPAFLRRRKEDVALQLPERVRSISMVPIHPAVVDTYEETMAHVARIASKKVLLPADLDMIQRLLVIARRCCNGPHMLGIDVDDRTVPKLAELEDLLREVCLGDGRKTVVFSEWTDMTARVVDLGRKLSIRTYLLAGSVPVKQRPALIRSFNETEGPALFVSTDAGGLGINLQAAEVVVNLDLPWNPARLEQRIARIHRIGSKHTVQEILFVTRNSVEERILALHDTKRDVLNNIWADSGEDVIAAPGGSGAFREMVRALIETQAFAEGLVPGSEEGDEEVPTVAEEETPLDTAARAAARYEEERSRQPTQPRPDATPRAPTAPALPRREPSDVEAGVDPGALVAPLAAALPAIPAEQRRPLATVFRALADALETN